MKTTFVTVKDERLMAASKIGLPNGWSGVALLPKVPSVLRQKRSLRAFRGCIDGVSEIQEAARVFSLPATHKGSNFAFVDARAWYAFLNRNNSSHENVASIILKPGKVLVTSAYELDQLEAWLKRDASLVQAALDFMWNIWNSQAVLMIRGSDSDELEGWRLYSDCRIAPDISFSSCTNYILMKRFGITRFIASSKVSRDFEILSQFTTYHTESQTTWADQGFADS